MRSMTVFNYLLEATLFGSVFILILFALRSILRDRLGSRAIYAAWSLVAIRLLVPLSLPNPAMDPLRPGFSTDVQARPVADQVRQRVIDAGYQIAQWMGREETGVLHAFSAHTDGGQTGRWLLLVWGIAAVCVGLWLFWRMDRFSARARRGRVRALDEDETAIYQELCQRYRVKDPPPVYYVDRISAGCVVGAVRPFIALPVETPRAHLSLLLAHQLCHLKAHDPFWGVVRSLCCALHWFNPLVWMAAWLSWRDSEMACDDRVTARLHDMDRLAYANAIVSAGQRSEGNMVSADAVGASFTDGHIRQRVTSIIRCGRGSRIGIAVLCLVAAGALLLSFGTSESEPLPTVAQVPSVTWAAAAQPIGSDMDAIACARRFLESDFVGMDTSRLSFAGGLAGDEWQVQAQAGAPILLRFSQGGYLLEFDATALLGDVRFTDTSYTHRMLTDSVHSYLTAFMTALVPGSDWVRAEADADVRAGDVRLLHGVLKDAQGRHVCEFILQVEPTVRMVYCITFAPEMNG